MAEEMVEEQEDIDDISFSKDDRAALCSDNRHRKSSTFLRHKFACYQWKYWKLFGIMTVCLLLIIALFMLSRTCESVGNSSHLLAPISHNPSAKNSHDLKNEATNCTDFPWFYTMLPQWAEPELYTLRIRPDIASANFTGEVEIKLKIKESTDLLVLNANKLTVTKVELKSADGRMVDVKTWTLCADKEMLAIVFKQMLNTNLQYTLSIKYWAPLTESMQGLYKSSYVNPQGQRRNLVVTQFEPTYARSMMPCWDEPAFKAQFVVKVVREPNLIALSNMDVERNETLPDGMVEDTFEKSMKMSTYLLAIVVCDFGRISRKTNNGVLVSIYAPTFQLDQAQWALNISVRGVEYYEEFFKVKYPLKKLDLISLNDFAAGAMENWGLITFRDTYLLYTPDISSTISEESVATVILHELAHQWFGNLVTMKWWNDLWLNEGFADFLETYATAQIEKEWNLMATFVANNIGSAMYLDGLVSTHSISVPVKEPAEIDSVFDAITYNKGASVLRMLMGLVGERKMKESLEDYLNLYKFANAEGKDLWDVIDRHVDHMEGLSVSEFMTSYTEQPGYPVVTIECKADHKWAASQKRFYFLRDEMDKPTNNQTWHIYITIVTDSGKTLAQWMRKDKQITMSSAESNPKWIKANTDSNGFYRVNYDKSNWKALTKQLATNHTVFSASDRTGLLNDAFAFLRQGVLEAEVVFEFFAYMANETARGPWAVLANYVGILEYNLRESEAYLPFKRFMKQFLTPVYQKIGWSQTMSHEAKLTQVQILMLACRYNVDNCVQKASEKFAEFLQNKTEKLSPDFRQVLCGSAVQLDPEETWERVFKLYNTTTVPSEKLDYLRCLGLTKDPWRLSRLLDMTLNPTQIRPNLLPTVINQVMANSNGKYLTWRFIQRRYDEIMKLISNNLLSTVIKSLTCFNTQFDYDQAVLFFKDKKLGSSKAAYDQTMETIRINIQFMNSTESQLSEYLKKKGFTSSLM